MCLGIPGKVISIDHSSEPLMGTVNFGGVSKQVCLAWVPDVRIGQYVIVHVGFGLNIIDEQEAVRVFDILNEMEQLETTAGDVG
jgi:hydrogenase expression/formation protein HypC